MWSPSTRKRSVSLCTAALTVCLLAFWALFARAAEVTVYGGAGQVSGSLTILRSRQLSLMIDCGAYYPDGAGNAAERSHRATANNAQLPSGATTCAFLVWTHAHLDHIGRTPLLVRSGFQGTILATDGTKAIAEVMLEMQIRYDDARQREWTWSTSTIGRMRDDLVVKAHWNPTCEFADAIAPRNRAQFRGTLTELQTHLTDEYSRDVSVSPCKVCARGEVRLIMDKVKTLAFDEEVRLDDTISIKLLYAGHIPGSASVLVTESAGPSDCRMLFSGDLGSSVSRLAPGPSPAPPVDAVFVETTYGATKRDINIRQDNRRFREDVARTVAAGGIAWIPAFALDRTQKILWELTTAQEEGLLNPEVPIYSPSPSGNDITELYRSHQASGWFAAKVGNDARAFQPSSIITKMPDSLPAGPAVFVSTSGMMDAAFAEQLAPLLEDRRNAVFIVGYQDPYTPGGELGPGAESVTIGDKKYAAAATIYRYECFSAHADANELDQWLSLQTRSTRLFLVHGGPAALETRAQALATKYAASVPTAGVSIAIRQGN